MSELNQDKKVLDEGRKQPLKDIDAPLRDQVVQKLYDKLVEMKVPHMVDKLWTGGSANRATWLERQRLYLSSWDEHLVQDSEGPFDGSSNLHLPMPFIVAKTLHARFIQALWPSEPSLNVRARNEASIERVPMVQDTMKYMLSDWANFNKGIEEVIDRFVWKWVTTGRGILKWRWDCRYTRFVDVVMEQKAAAPIFQTGPDGKEIAVPQFKMVEVEKPVTKKTFEGPVCELVDPEDIIIIGGKGDPDDADAVLHRQWLTASELWTLADRKIFDKEAVEEIIEGGPDTVEGSIGSEIKQARAQNAGKAALDTDQDLDRYQIIEAYLRLDVDGSGINSDVIAWVHPRSRELARATYLYRVSQTGERPFAVSDFQIREQDGAEYPVGVIELIYPLSKEMDAIHNMRIDFGLVSVMPFGFYRASSGIDPETIQLEPGALIPVDNPGTDVFFPNLGNRTIFGMQEEQALQGMIERLTGVNDMSLGMISGAQGATRTASGARILSGEMSSNLDVFLRRLNRGHKKSLRYSFHMLQQRIPDGLSFRVTGDDGNDYWRQVRRDDFARADIDLDVSPNSSSSNQSVQQDLADQILQMTANPLDIQLQLITPAQRFEAHRNWYQSRGIKDWGRYVVRPQGQTYRLTPEEEANRVLRGMDVQLSPDMDHEGFINWYDMVKKDDHLLGQFTPEQAMALERQSRLHQQMMQALKQMQAQQANAQQMRMNGQQSQQQAPSAPMPPGGAAPNGPQAIPQQ
jgi:hypothetical protein